MRNSLFVNEIVHLLLMQLVAGHQVTRNYTFHFHFRVPYDIIQGVWEDCNAHQMHIRWRTSYYWIGHLEWKENQKSGKICHRANSSMQGKMKESPLIDTVDHHWIINLRGYVFYLWFWWNILHFPLITYHFYFIIHTQKLIFLQLKKSFLNFHILSSVNNSLVCGQNARVKPL